jgi:hypothetical protein
MNALDWLRLADVPRFAGGQDASTFMDAVRQQWPKDRDTPSCDLMSIIEAAVETYPNSASLWCMLGNLIALGGMPQVFHLSEKDCYSAAIKLDPICGQAYTDLGFLIDISATTDPELSTDAESCFRLAIACDGSADSYRGLARILAERGDVTAARDTLDLAREMYEGMLKNINDENASLAKPKSETEPKDGT